MQLLKYEDLHQGGFAGLLERRFVTDLRVFGRHKRAETANGIGNFVYLADANFLPHGETGLHPHRAIDVISVMVDGRIDHEGSLENGASLEAGMVQVQRAGDEGFTHNEINPDNSPNHMIQLWVLPDEEGESAGYRVYSPGKGERMQVYGGDKNQDERFYSRTCIDVANLEAGQSVNHANEVMGYLPKGSGVANHESVEARTLIRADGIEFTANEDSQLIMIYVN